MELKRVGFYKEMPHGEADDPSIFNNIGKKIENEKTKDYLKNGIVLAACGGIVEDIICPEKGSAGCPNLVTDGYWIWPGDLQYYVANYGLELDPEFIKYMENNNWEIPIGEENIDIDNISII